MVREKVPAAIFLVNNNGYTVERAINGEDEYLQRHPGVGLVQDARFLWGWRLWAYAAGHYWRGAQESVAVATANRTSWSLLKR